MKQEMQSVQNSVLIQGATLQDIESMINRAVENRMEEFYTRIKGKPPTLIRRKVAAQRLGISLPTLLSYTKAGFLHARHLGGQVYYDEAEIEHYQQNNK